MARTTLPGKFYIGIDNGVSGSIGVVNHNATHCEFYQTPVKSCFNYTKEMQRVNRVDVVELKQILSNFPNAVALVERPMVNPGRFKATASALRAMEATLIILEDLAIPYHWVDSKQWQKALLPSGVKGDDLKPASKEIATRLFPGLREKIKPDGDGLLIAEWGRRNNL